LLFQNACPQDTQHQGEAHQEAEAELANPSEDLCDDRQSDLIQHQAPPLVDDLAQLVNLAQHGRHLCCLDFKNELNKQIFVL
jgi:hypothetical protein